MKSLFIASLVFLGTFLISFFVFNNLTYEIGTSLNLDRASSDALFLAGITASLGLSGIVAFRAQEKYKNAMKQVSRQPETKT